MFAAFGSAPSRDTQLLESFHMHHRRCTSLPQQVVPPVLIPAEVLQPGSKPSFQQSAFSQDTLAMHTPCSVAT